MIKFELPYTQACLRASRLHEMCLTLFLQDFFEKSAEDAALRSFPSKSGCHSNRAPINHEDFNTLALKLLGSVQAAA